jgi:hypothetical protein
MPKKINLDLLNATVFDYVNGIMNGDGSVKNTLRITNKEWQALLLNNGDRFFCRGKMIKLIATPLGVGVQEITYRC